MRKDVSLFLASIPFVIAAVGLLYLAQSPWLGVRLSRSGDAWVVEEASQPSLEPLEGATVAAINGKDVCPHDLTEDFDYVPDRESLQRWWTMRKHLSKTVVVGEPTRLSVESDGVVHNVDVVAKRLGYSRALSRAWLMYTLGLISLAIGLIVVLKRPRDQRAILFFVMVYCVGGIFTTFGTYTSREIGFSYPLLRLLWFLNMIHFSWFPVVFLHFCLVFPRQRRIAANRYFVVALYALPLLVTLIYQPRISFSSLNLLFLGGLGVGTLSLVVRYFRTLSIIEKYQLRWVLFGVLTFVGVFCATTLVPNIVLGHRLTSDRVPSLFFVAIPLTIAFAVTRYRLMDIDALLDQSVAFVVTLSLIVTVDFVIIQLLRSLSSRAGAWGRTETIVVSVFFSLIVYRPLRQTLLSGIRKAFHRFEYDPQSVYRQTSAALVRSETSRDIAMTLEHMSRSAFDPTGSALFFCSECKGGGNPDTEAGARKAACVQAEAVSVPVALAEASFELDGLDFDHSAGVLVPLRSQAATVGCIVLGSKRSGQMYSSQDMAFLDDLSNQGLMALEAIRQREENRRAVERARHDRRRISREIHDGIGSSFTNSLMALSVLEEQLAPVQVDGGESLPQEKKKLAQIRRLLNHGLAEYRDLVWALGEQQYSLNDLVELVQQKLPISVEGTDINAEVVVEDVSGANRPIGLPVRHNVTRIVQEAAANAVKHAGPTEVQVRIASASDHFSVVITDNGCGFSVEEKAGSGHGLTNMANRAHEIGADFSICSAAGNGTTVRVEVPFAKEREQPLPNRGAAGESR